MWDTGVYGRVGVCDKAGIGRERWTMRVGRDHGESAKDGIGI